MALESVGGSVISKIAELMVEPVGRQFRYMFCFNNFVEEFKERKENLGLALDGLQKDVEAAERNAEEIKKGVKKWLEDATKAIDHEDVSHLENEIGKNGKCFTWCPNCMRQFKLSKALAKKSETFRKLLETKFTKVADKAPPQPIEFLPSKEFTPSESSKEAFKQIMEALKDDSVNMIGLYGMGGVGKTTLVKEVGRKAKELKPPLDEVLMATVSQNPNVIDIQDRMAEKLGLEFKEKTKEGRADRLWKRLQGKKMLIILDDVWKHIDLKEIGIPFGDDHRGCKILLTTRRQGVCSSMVCQQRVLLSPLPEKEAWDLFRINAGLRDGNSTLNTVARVVARECQGLPIALVTVGRALRDASARQWESASRQLKESQFARMEQIDEENNSYTCLKLSYDYLKLDETKSCFVLCCLFPEDYDIPIEDLTRYAVGYGLHQDAEPIEDARKRVSVAIENLKDCCMLLGSETEEHVRMHDLVRDFAIQIASSEEYGFMVKAGLGLEKWQWTGKSFEGCTTISLMGNQLAELPEGLVCPRLKVLLLEVAYGLNVPQRFFEGMKEIEVLSLKGGRLSLQSLELSTKLQSLVLIWCECKDLIWLRKLQRLRILGLMWSFSIEELPDEIGELKELRLLDVTGCPRLRRIPVNLIGRLKKLEELLIGDGSFQGWDVGGGCDSTGGMNASLTELNSLSQLAVLSLTIPKVECIPRDFVFPVSLRKYHIILGCWAEAGQYPSSTRLSLEGTSFNAKTFEQLFLHKLEFVKVRGCGDVFTLFPAKLRQGLKNLKEVIVDSCESLEEVFELGKADEGSSEEKQMPLLSSLTTLQLSWLPELKCIWKGPTRNVSLKNLVHLKVSHLNKLTFIFTPSLARNLPKLERLYIEVCRRLKHIIREEDDEREIIPESPGFPKLKTLYISFCFSLEYVFPVSMSPSLANLEQMTIDRADNLKQIFYGGEGDGLPRDGIIKFPRLRELSLEFRSNYSFFGPTNFDAQLPLQQLTIKGHEEVGNWLAQLQQNGFLQRLESVQVDDCGDVRAPFPALKNLKGVTVDSCKSLEEVFELGELPDEGHSEEKELLSSLTELRLLGLPELKCIWKGSTRNVSLQSLYLLNLSSLNKLTFIFTQSLAQSLPKLEKLEISKCGELKHIIREEDGEREIIPESPCFPKLKTLLISGCGKLEYVFPVSVSLTLQSLPQLKTLEIRDCHELKHIIREEDGEREIIPESPGFPKLKTIIIKECGKLEYVFPVSPSLLNLEKMQISDVDNLKQIFYSGEGDALTTDGIIKFPRLSELDLSSRSNYSFFGPKNFAAQLPYLQILKINGHKELGNLSAQLQQNGFLQRLEIVRMKDCGDVRAPFPAKLLQALKNQWRVEIEDCKSLEEVFELGELPDEGRSEEKELLSSLTKLQLQRLPELKCIWKGPTRHLSLHSLAHLKLDYLDKLTFIFTPSLAQSLRKLERLEISKCGELKHIIREKDGERDIIPESPCVDVRTPFPAKLLRALKNLKEVIVDSCKSLEVVFELGELPDEGCSEEKELLSSLTELWLFELPELKCIWKGPTGNVSLQSLYFLNLSYLNKLTFIFTPSLAQSLPKLERLYISKCGQLKHIIREEDGEREIIPESPGQDDQASPINVGKEIVLPNLKEFSLVQLSSIACFSFGWCDYFLFPRLERLKVHQCPKLTTKFATTPDGSMSAQSKVSEVAEDSSINREWTRNNGWKEVKEEEELFMGVRLLFQNRRRRY